MTWLKIDDKFTEHPKIAAVGGWGAWLHLQAIAYCNRNLTDGFVPDGALETLRVNGRTFAEDGSRWTLGATSGAVGRDVVEVDWTAMMIEAGLWEPADGGIRVHDYHDYNPSKEAVLSVRNERVSGHAAGGYARVNNAPRDEKGRLLPTSSKNSAGRDVSSNDGRSGPATSPSKSSNVQQKSQQQKLLDSSDPAPVPGPVPGPPSPTRNQEVISEGGETRPGPPGSSGDFKRGNGRDPLEPTAPPEVRAAAEKRLVGDAWFESGGTSPKPEPWRTAMSYGPDSRNDERERLLLWEDGDDEAFTRHVFEMGPTP